MRLSQEISQYVLAPKGFACLPLCSVHAGCLLVFTNRLLELEANPQSAALPRGWGGGVGVWGVEETGTFATGEG